MLIVANWKMNGSKTLVQDCLSYWQSAPTKHTVVLCPPFPLLDCALHHSRFVKIGAQTCHHAEKGAYTGQVSVPQLKEMGCDYVLVGHSECRQHMLETNEQILKKATLVLEHGMTPIICVGETLEHYEKGISQDVVDAQLQACLPSSPNFFIAYEPVWAIGTGKTATENDITKMHTFIAERFESLGILYGGSVTAQNASQILSLPHVRGLLVGGSSLKKEDFHQIINTQP